MGKNCSLSSKWRKAAASGYKKTLIIKPDMYITTIGVIGVFDVKFKNGEKNGPVLENYSDGKLYLNGFYKDNEKDGKWEYFDREGKTSAILNYSKGEQDGKQELFLP